MGRAAYLDLYAHYLGENNVNNMASQTEAKIRNLHYTGESRWFNFNIYVSRLKEYHTTLNELVPLGYSGVDAATRVRNLLDGINTTSYGFPAVHAQVLSHVESADVTLTRSVSHLPGLPQVRARRITRRQLCKLRQSVPEVVAMVAVVVQRTGEDKYYTKAEWQKLVQCSAGACTRTLEEAEGWQWWEQGW